MTSKKKPNPYAEQTAWSADELKDMHSRSDKAQRVQRMFSAIAESYDTNNRVHSLGRDQAWRRAAVRAANPDPEDVVLDVACGTGDLTRAFAISPAKEVIGVDFTPDMLRVAEAKPPLKDAAPITYVQGDAMQLPFDDGSVDVVSIAFGIRNVADPARAVAEFHRVLRPAGRCVILEFSLPRRAPLRLLYNVYFRRIMPITATLISRDRSGAYRYLPESVNTFVGREQIIGLLEDAGFVNVTHRPLTFGIAVLYRGERA
ncbi:MAG: bifunctional demethylmenaquinone methyltransferase/2-methoxy-6-polyprenyl-1,4-benzoquinol methylase UbiE [Phycisphaerales bacterium]|nr:bifunctional demethylmenaquinone methyltransferase/2-methoxy-6-polyprenyl-1,4-benzoquinol methylase UbiE [Phycisphaerales bacterium]